tara:strand:+ start:867 stop:1070 length:204 start_codon:yes stop_codon:yes gene_type:complete
MKKFLSTGRCEVITGNDAYVQRHIQVIMDRGCEITNIGAGYNQYQTVTAVVTYKEPTEDSFPYYVPY